jgi:chromosomal replication initiation ATPase DnaA
MTLREIAETVGRERGFYVQDMRAATSRQRARLRARQEAMSRQYEAGFSNEQVARFWGRHHTTVIYARRAFPASGGVTDHFRP